MFNNSLIAGSSGQSSGGFYDTEISQSLRFNDDDSAYLSWTPASAGNRKTWTWSGWVKRGNLTGTDLALFGCSIDSYNRLLIIFDASDNINVQWRTAQGSTKRIETSAVYRDVSAWYHIVVKSDATQATASDRLKLYVNGEEVTAFSADSRADYTQNADTAINSTYAHTIGEYAGGMRLDGYLAEVNFIDGTALDPTSFGEFKSGVWIPKSYSGSYGTNGFYLPFEAGEGIESGNFNAVTWTGNGSTQSITGVGFQPDLVWIKERSSTSTPHMFDTVRGATYGLNTNNTDAEWTYSNTLTSFNSDGFSLGNGGGENESSQTYVAWCWDAGSSSAASNSDGSITSTVKADTTNGFSIVSYTGNGSSSATVGHGLGSVPDMVICKRRDSAAQWFVKHTDLSSNNSLCLNLTNAEFSPSDGSIADLSSSSTFGFYQGDNVNNVNASGGTYIAYCFSSVTGVSKFGSYTGDGTTDQPITTGFRPAMVMVKKINSVGDWTIHDNERSNGALRLYANEYDPEGSGYAIGFTDTGFTLACGCGNWNNSGDEYIYMAFADTSVSYPLESDFSGNNNDFTANNLEATDVVLDSPTNNFATLNPIAPQGYSLGTLSEGNLASIDNTTNSVVVANTIPIPKSGKWYFETNLTTYSGGADCFLQFVNKYNYSSADVNSYYRVNSGTIGNFGGGTQSTSSSTQGDIIGFAFDATSQSLQYYKNGSALGSATTYTNEEEFLFVIVYNNTGGNKTVTCNFGQDSSFAGNKTPQGNTDDNGYGDFYYAPPSGYLALCTANLPDPVASIDPAQDGSPQDHFNTVLWTGNSSTQAITGVGFQPDAVWIKGRNDGTYNHQLNDAVRGADNTLLPNTTTAEADYNSFTSFDSDGFTLPSALGTNVTGTTYVAWNWKADNTSGSSNTDGSITSTVSANTDAGFSIVSYHGSETNSTIGHGLNSAPEVIITKDRSTTFGWGVYHKSMGAGNIIYLHSTSPQDANTTVWQNTTPSSSVFYVGNTTYANSDRDYIAYCFHSVDGFSKFGSYTGNGSSDGTFIYTGFTPAWVLFKRSSISGEWFIYDSTRDTVQPIDSWLWAHSSNAETTSSSYKVDFLSNGFKMRYSSTINSSGYTYIYMAFAENPFKYANAR